MARARTAATQPPPQPAAPSMPWAAPGSLSQTSTRAVLPGERAHYLYHMPGQYMALAGWCVPQLQPLYAGEAGVSGVEARRAPGRRVWVADPEAAIVRIQRKGGTVIPHEVDAEQGHPSYLVPVGSSGTYAHRLQPLVPGLPPRPAPAEDYAAWLRSLMDRGLIEQPHAAEVRAIGEHLRSSWEAHRSQATSSTDRLQDAWQQYQQRALVEQV